jgi:hypothetical protein
LDSHDSESSRRTASYFGGTSTTVSQLALGQLISNVSGWADQNVWDIEDREMLAAVEEHLQVLAQRSHEVQT